MTLIFIRGGLVRITGTGPANVLETRSEIKVGPAKGIWVYPGEKETMEQKYRFIQDKTKNDDMLYLGNSALCNVAANGRFVSANCISTPVFDQQWVHYFEAHPEETPTIIFLDTDFLDPMHFYDQTLFGRYIKDQWQDIPQYFIGTIRNP